MDYRVEMSHAIMTSIDHNEGDHENKSVLMNQAPSMCGDLHRGTYANLTDFMTDKTETGFM